ncbi:MAG: hypothetical protein KGZ50_01410 [Peptococcaceae bacterium]|nr:hypothetical protein [Peptococcaceae bacterium]
MSTFDYTEREILWTLHITASRSKAIDALEKTLPHTEEPLLVEAAHGLLAKLRQMTDKEFATADKQHLDWEEQ